ncbi:MAG: DUF1580 domain-containing protein [Planctomycetes bacterium]|nr:DUF1580 domain-containing protein [Planctomycetota bacterium]
MSIDTQSEELLSIKEAVGHFPTSPNVTTVWRWALYGVRGVKLESALIGGQRRTSKEAIERFIEATTARAAGEPVEIRTPRRRQRDIERAAAELERDGI